jgi:hypothetical protein
MCLKSIKDISDEDAETFSAIKGGLILNGLNSLIDTAA